MYTYDRLVGLDIHMYILWYQSIKLVWLVDIAYAVVPWDFLFSNDDNKAPTFDWNIWCSCFNRCSCSVTKWVHESAKDLIEACKGLVEVVLLLLLDDDDDDEDVAVWLLSCRHDKDWWLPSSCGMWWVYIGDVTVMEWSSSSSSPSIGLLSDTEAPSSVVDVSSYIQES